MKDRKILIPTIAFIAHNIKINKYCSMFYFHKFMEQGRVHDRPKDYISQFFLK